MSDILTPLLPPPLPKHFISRRKDNRYFVPECQLFFCFTYEISGGVRAAAIHLLLLFQNKVCFETKQLFCSFLIL